MNDEKSLYQADRRKNLREEDTDRRDQPRPTSQMTKFKIIVVATAVILLAFIIYIINPTI